MKSQPERNINAYKLFRPRQLNHTDETKRSKVFYHVTWPCHQISFDAFSLKKSPFHTPQSTICFTQFWFLALTFGKPGFQSQLFVPSGPTCPRDSVRAQEMFPSVRVNNGQLLITEKLKVSA